jgi:alkylhydroperoxidase family enzyme
MRMSRLTPVPLEQWAPELREMFGGVDPDPIERGSLRITAQRPDLALPLAQFGRALRVHRTLPERLMELVRLRIAFHNQCRSCMAIRYASAVDDGLEEAAVCSLQQPYEAPDLSDAERLAIEYGERMATNHLSIDDAMYDRLRAVFTEPQIVELGLWAAHCVGMGRLAATWHMVEDLPEPFRQEGDAPIGPWSGEPVVVNRKKAEVPAG